MGRSRRAVYGGIFGKGDGWQDAAAIDRRDDRSEQGRNRIDQADGVLNLDLRETLAAIYMLTLALCTIAAAVRSRRNDLRISSSRS